MNNMKMIKYAIILLSCSMSTAYISAQANIAMGTSSATGDNSFAAGDSSMAIGATTLAMGNKAKALGDFSLSLGDQTTAMGKWSQAYGFGSFAEGDYSLASGFFNRAWTFGVAIGAANYAATDGAIAMGRDNIASGSSSTVMGTWSRARSYGETVLGAYSEDYTPSANGIFQWEPTDRLFVIANGRGDGAGNGIYSNALTMLKNGDTDMVGHLKLEKTLTVGEDTLQTEFDEGQIRYNQQTQDIEGYAQEQWSSLTGLTSASVADIGSWDIITEPATSTATATSTQARNSNSNLSEVVQFLYDPAKGITGESEDLVMNPLKAIDILAFDWGISSNINIESKSGGSGAGKARFGTATILMKMNGGAIGLMSESAEGGLINDLVLQQRERTPINTPDIDSFFAKVEMKTIAVESVDFYMPEGASQELVRVTLRFGSVRVTNQLRNDQGVFTQIGPVFMWNQLSNNGSF